MYRTTVMLAMALAMAGFSAPAMAGDLEGVWNFRREAWNGIHSGTIVVDQRGDARLKGHESAQSYVECGTVLSKGEGIEFVFTFARAERGGYNADHFYCTPSGEHSFGCYNIDAGGTYEATIFTMTRVGGVPESPDGRLEGICPIRNSPNA